MLSLKLFGRAIHDGDALGLAANRPLKRSLIDGLDWAEPMAVGDDDEARRTGEKVEEVL